MMGRVIVLDEIEERPAAALMVNGRLADLVIDPEDPDAPRPGAIYRGIAGRPMKGLGGIFIDLGGGRQGFLKNARGVSSGKPVLVQVTGWPEDGKAPTVTTRLLFKSRYGILTPDAPGINVSRQVKGHAERDRLEEIGVNVLGDLADRERLGFILRSAAEGVDEAIIAADLEQVLDIARKVLAEGEGREPELLLAAPDAHTFAWSEWAVPDPDEVIERPGAFAEEGVIEEIEKLARREVPIGAGASLIIEPTRALVAVDVNTGPDTSPAAGLKTNLRAARELPRQLRLRGLGGQIVVDMAPMPKKDRKALEDALKAALRADGIDTAILGWTNLGHLELQRRRERLPLHRSGIFEALGIAGGERMGAGAGHDR